MNKITCVCFNYTHLYTYTLYVYVSIHLCMYIHTQTRKLSCVQWRQLRRLMGKPRRCSPTFFAEERALMEFRRNKVRELQQQVHQGIVSVGMHVEPWSPCRMYAFSEIYQNVHFPYTCVVQDNHRHDCYTVTMYMLYVYVYTCTCLPL